MNLFFEFETNSYICTQFVILVENTCELFKENLENISYQKSQRFTVGLISNIRNLTFRHPQRFSSHSDCWFQRCNVVFVHIVSTVRRLFLSEQSLFFRICGMSVRRANFPEFVERTVSLHERELS